MSCVIHPRQLTVGPCTQCERVVCEQCQASKPGKPLLCNICAGKSSPRFRFMSLLAMIVVLGAAIPVVVMTLGWRTNRAPEISVYDGQAWRTYTRDDGIEIGSVVAVAVDERGDLWFAGGAYGGGVDRFLVEQETWKHYSRHDGKPKFSNEKPMYSNWARDVAADGGVVWVATAVGLLRFEDEVWSAISISSGRPVFEVMEEICGGSSKCISSARDGRENAEAVYAVAAADGHMWAAADDGSLAHWDGSQWTRIPAQEALGPDFRKGIKSYQDPISTLALSDGVLWVGTLNQGVLRYDGQDWQRFDSSQGLPSDHVRDLEVFAGRVWVATPQGAAWIDEGAGKINVSLLGLDVRSIIGDAQQAYLATSDGLIVLDLSSDEYTIHDAETGLPHSECLDVALDRQGRVWVATQSPSVFSRYRMILMFCPVGLLSLLFFGYLFYRWRKSPATTTLQKSKELADQFGAPEEEKGMRERAMSISSLVLKLLILLAIVLPAARGLADNLDIVIVVLLLGFSIPLFLWEIATLLPARFYIKRGDYARAERIVRIGLKLHSRSTNLNIARQVIHSRQGHFVDAVQVARRVVRLAPGQAMVYSNLGGLLPHLSQYAEAEAACQAALSLDARHTSAFNNLAWALVMSKRQLERAEALLHIALGLTSSKERLGACTGTLSQVYFEMGKIPEALDKAEEALQLTESAGRDCHQLASGHYWLGTFQRVAAMDDAARQNLQSALDLDPHGLYAGKARRALKEMG